MAAAYFYTASEKSTIEWRIVAGWKTENWWFVNIKYWVDLLCTLSEKRYLTVRGRRSIPKDVIGSWDLPSSGILRKDSGYSLSTFRDKLSVPSSSVKKSWKKIYLKVETDTLITEMRAEKIFYLNASCLFFTYPFTWRVCCVFCVEYFRLPHTHYCSTFRIN